MSTICKRLIDKLCDQVSGTVLPCVMVFASLFVVLTSILLGEKIFDGFSCSIIVMWLCGTRLVTLVAWQSVFWHTLLR